MGRRGLYASVHRAVPLQGMGSGDADAGMGSVKTEVDPNEYFAVAAPSFAALGP